MISMYPAIFFKEEPEGYSVLFPDLNWLGTCGENKQEAMEMAIDCLAGYLHTSWLDNDKVPEPSDIKDIDVKFYAKELGDNSEDIDAFVTMVSVDVEEYAKLHFSKSVRKTLTIPAWLDKEARKAKINFSKTLQEALLQKLHQ